LPDPFFIDSLESFDMSISAINVRNQFKGKVKEIIRGPVVSEVDVDTPFGIGRLGSGRAREVDGGIDRAPLSA
jgi:hypothetical protein